jgi:hypothetical protein
MMGKWDGLKNKYPKTPVGKMTEYGNDSAFLDKVNARKDELRQQWGGSPNGYMTDMLEADREKKEFDDLITERNVTIEACSQLLMDHFENQQMTLIRSDLGQTFFTAIEPYPTVTDKAALETFIQERPHLQYLWVINMQGVKALVKAYLEDGRDAEIPPCISVFLKTEVRHRKS